MKTSKLYLVKGFSREPYDNSTIILDAFESKELAEKCANGLDDVEDTRINTWIIKQAERDEKLANITYLLDEQYDAQADVIYEEYEKYEVYYTFFYSVQEIDLIN